MGCCPSAERGAKEAGVGGEATQNADQNQLKGIQKKNVPEQLIIFVLGGPGSGKGVQCQKMVEKFDFVHISVGELLRQEVAKKSPIGIECEKIMKEGKLVPLDIVLKLLKSAMDASSKKHFLIDGFPRLVEQAKSFEAQIGRPDMVIFLDCPVETLEHRLLQRGNTSGRVDDNEETIKKRIETFMNETVPVLAYYEKTSPKIVKKVDGMRSPEEVFMEISKSLKETFGLEDKTSIYKA